MKQLSLKSDKEIELISYENNKFSFFKVVSLKVLRVLGLKCFEC